MYRGVCVPTAWRYGEARFLLMGEERSGAGCMHGLEMSHMAHLYQAMTPTPPPVPCPALVRPARRSCFLGLVAYLLFSPPNYGHTQTGYTPPPSSHRCLRFAENRPRAESPQHLWLPGSVRRRAPPVPGLRVPRQRYPRRPPSQQATPDHRHP